MAIDIKHPRYEELQPDWEVMRDTYRGERVVKSKGIKYLPATQGMILDGMKTANDVGTKAYNAYRTRAIFPEYTKQAVENYIGMLWRKPAAIKLPSALEPMRDSCTPAGESLYQLLRRVNEEQLVTGRCGLLLDLPESAESTVLPYIAFYIGESVINWDVNQMGEGHTELNLVVLDETGLRRRADFSWQAFKKYRLLALGDLTTNEPNGTANYRQGVFTDETGLQYYDGAMFEPSFRGKKLSQIPFVFVNTKDLLPDTDEAPLISLARQCLAIYRGEADYRQTLFMQGQETLVVIGGANNTDDNQVLRTGTGARIDIEQGGDAKFIGVSSRGLPEQRYSLANDRLRAEIVAGQLTNTTDKVESGLALQTRLGAQKSVLTQIALTGAAALERILKIAAEWVGANPDEVSVEPNLDFATNELAGQDLLLYMQARQLGAPISNESIHKLMVSKGMTTMDFIEEMKILEAELKEEDKRRAARAVKTDAGFQVNVDGQKSQLHDDLK